MTAHPVRPDLAAMRRSYAREGLDESRAARDPLEQFARWFHDALAAGLDEPNAMVLATATPAGVPSARTVLLKGYDAAGFAFYTNTGSQKARELAANPQAALVFPWHALDRQVRLVGPTRPLTRDEAAGYFASRPHGSRLGAWASRQSSVIASRAQLEERLAELEARWPEGTEVPLPDFWGGYRLVPETVEFWAGRDNRLHDRLRYRRDGASGWVVERLAP
ncbi:MAG: pyridoxamine 5-phosphate oxidase [Actinomycetota bacterium]|jgi:pyridoxamine 5'-phosphate oxidase|nr:pyridoxamine 5-phosphate oxidase [Actinomycetota bacterium]